MSTLLIRNVPEDVYERLRGAAQANGRSLNAEVIVRLSRDAGGWRGDPAWWAQFEARRARMRAALADVTPTPEELIRHDRDSR